jgi:hypothetical protein
MDNNQIKEAFLETNYIVLIENGIVLKIGEFPIQLVEKFPQIKAWAFITAWNPLPDILTKTENDDRNNQLRDQLESEEFVYHPGIGISKSEDWSEDSFFIMNIELKEANAISSKYGQLAFLYGDLANGNQLIFTKKSFKF